MNGDLSTSHFTWTLGLLKIVLTSFGIFSNLYKKTNMSICFSASPVLVPILDQPRLDLTDRRRRHSAIFVGKFTPKVTDLSVTFHPFCVQRSGLFGEKKSPMHMLEGLFAWHTSKCNGLRHAPL